MRVADPASVDAYIAALPRDQRDALTTFRTRLRALLPDHIEVLSYAMPGFRQPGPKGKMVVGYAAFAKHLGLYPHSGSVIPRIDCSPFKTSKSGVLFTADQPLPDALLRQIIETRQAEIAAGYSRKA
ncbi:iron chaperone [Tabrizicola sp.]|uniref:iron chaperone n=1 Tax=Tabrizicola sp. TaxID=2005166 RepID=UPI002FDE53A2